MSTLSANAAVPPSDTPTDRRVEPRRPLCRPVKLRPEHGATRYLAGRTRNFSPGGALIELDHTTALHRGDTVRLAIDTEDQAALLHADRMVQATVLRRDDQHVAVRFAERQAV